MARRHIPNGSAAAGSDPLLITPDDAGWIYCGIQVITLAPGTERTVETGGSEVIMLPLSATDVTVGAAGETFTLAGRESVFTKVSDFCYVGRDSTMTLACAGGGEVAIASARCDEVLPPRYGSAADVAVEVRGAGPATRQVTNFASPDAWPHASKIMCVELLTPDGNWSSYPPHRHDDSPECPVNNEEIYYFRVANERMEYDPEGFAMHRTYTPDGEIDDTLVVRDGDVYLVPKGYHGPCISAPGYPLYYLNVLAGPGGERSMAFCDDPTHTWVRDTWSSMPLDPRCPMTSADGPVAS
ncbi:MAG: 5-deoxy-glucuronate isomerase [Actinomycetota bacterium]